MSVEENPFKKYEFYKYENGKIVGVNSDTIETTDESFQLFQELYDQHYGSIEIDENLVAIHTGGWSENEYLVFEFMKSAWWIRFHKITQSGGHYFFNTDIHGDKNWKVVSE